MYKSFIIILSGLCLLLAPNSAIAAEVFFSPSEHLAKQDNPYTTTIILKTDQKCKLRGQFKINTLGDSENETPTQTWLKAWSAELSKEMFLNVEIIWIIL